MTVEDITKLYVDEKKSAKEIAAIYNVEVKKVQWFIKKNNISKHNKCSHKINRDYQVKQVSKEDIIKYYIDENMFLKDAAVKLNISEPTLRKKIQEYGIVKPKELIREHVMEAYEKINITEEELRNLYLDKNYSSLDIAKMYGCTKRTILLKLKKYGITDEKSDDVRNENMVKKLNNTLTEKYGEDLSGIYKDIDKEGKPLHSWWTGGTDKDACGSPDKWEKAYNSDEQKAIRQALNVKGMEE